MPVRKIVNPRRRASRDAHGRFKLKKNRARRVHAHVNRRRHTVRTHTNRARRKVTVRSVRRVRNPSLVLMGLNPVRTGRSHMAGKKRSRYRLKSRTNRRRSHLATRSNPSHRRRYRLKNRRNPFGFSTPLFLETAGWVIVGGMLTRIVPQAVLPNNNTGIVGYGLNALTGGVAAWLAGQYKREAGLGVALGSTMMLAARIVSDYFGKTLVTFGTISSADGTTATVTPVATTNAPAAQLSGLRQGDLQFDLRDYRGTYFPLPSSTSGKDLTGKTPWTADISKLQSALTAGKGISASTAITKTAPKSNMAPKPTSLTGGRFGGVM
jgi:hypothetical protein